MSVRGADKVNQFGANRPEVTVPRNRRIPILPVMNVVLLQTFLVWTSLSLPALMATAPDVTSEQTLVAKFVELNGSKSGLVVEGFNAAQLDALQQLKSEPANLQKCVRLYVVSDKVANWKELDKSPSVMGKASIVVDPPSLIFEPRFSLRNGIRYLVRVQLEGCDFQSELFRPTASTSPATMVERAFPSATQLPENLLKFYVHFSHPMAMRDVYKHIHLVDEDGRELIHPFLEIQEELWDPSARRLTLLLDPGRIKRGLVPNLEDGSILHQGTSYELRVDAALQDAQGQPLVRAFTKRFATVDSDHKQPLLDEWKIDLPQLGTRNPLSIRFGESLDYALASRGIRLHLAGSSLAGQFSLSDDETECRFLPAEDWRAGEYELQVDTYVEDLAGNSFRKPFEIEMDEGQRQLPDGFLTRRFDLE